jgi:hypothetical protein
LRSKAKGAQSQHLGLAHLGFEQQHYIYWGAKLKKNNNNNNKKKIQGKILIFYFLGKTKPPKVAPPLPN